MESTQNQDKSNGHLRIQRDNILLTGIDVSEESNLIKGEEYSRNKSSEQFKNNPDYGFRVIYDEYGKPWPEDKSGFVSISHTNKWLFISYSSNINHGIDIEHERVQLSRIAPRILDASEMSLLSQSKHLQNALQIFWGAKEALYKAHGRRKLDFKENIRVERFDSEVPCAFKGHLMLSNKTISFELEWLKPDDNSWLVFITKQLSD